MKLYELTDNLKDDLPFEFDKTKKLGHIRCQFGNEKQIANQFVPMENLGEKIKEYEIDLKPINKVCDLMQFEWIVNYDVLYNLCKGDNETNYFYQDEQCDYWIRLNPFGTNDYNCYIHIFHK